jgi:hypothetical protein
VRCSETNSNNAAGLWPGMVKQSASQDGRSPLRLLVVFLKRSTFPSLDRPLKQAYQNEHGTRMRWRHRNDVVLFDGRYCYWRCEGIINRTYRISYLDGGRPSDETLAKLRKRFWPTRKDRRYYNYIDKF